MALAEEVKTPTYECTKVGKVEYIENNTKYGHYRDRKRLRNKDTQ